MTKTIDQVQHEVEAILIEHNARGLVWVKEVMKKTGARSWMREGTGAYQIDISSFRQRGSRRHLFRTSKEGVVPVQKIVEIAKRVAAFIEAEARIAAGKDANKDIALEVREYARAVVGNYWSEWQSTACQYVVPSATEGKVVVSLNAMTLTAEQAKELLDLVASFK